MPIISTRLYDSLIKIKRPFCMICNEYKSVLNSNGIKVGMLPKCSNYCCSKCLYYYIVDNFKKDIIDIKCPVEYCRDVFNGCINYYNNI